MKNNTIEKYKLSRTFQEQQPLKIFFMCVKQGATERFIGVIGYNHEECFKKARETYISVPPGVIISHGDYELIENILKSVKTDGVTIVQEQPAKPEPKKLTKQQFINNTLLIADEMIIDKEDRKKIKEIIEKVK